ncbi:MAG: hypothetical protein ACNA8S_10745 [Deferrisomatales bacterium]
MALKYGQEPEIVDRVLDQYLTGTDARYARMKAAAHGSDDADDTSDTEDPLTSFIIEKDVFASAVYRTAQAQLLDAKVAAALLFDYRLWMTIQDLDGGR